MAVEFKHDWLEEFYEEETTHRKIPSSIRSALYRKIFILDAATSDADLRVPPNNRFEHLEDNLKGWCSIRVNKKYRLVFKWNNGVAEDTYLDDHSYR
ncbi:HigB toxin protein [Vibrio astriarenae]|nr:HigB toxin protein [Vibrio sp. C7]